MNESNEERFEKILRDTEHIPNEGIASMKEVAERLLEKLQSPENRSGLLYGKVQSGKTNSTIMCIARLIDSGQFKLFIVLTSDNKSLYKQTLSRITAGLKTIAIVGYNDISNGNESQESFITKLKHSGAVIICTKNPNNLRNLNRFLNRLKIEDIQAVIFDDEADFGSLNSKQNQKEESEVYHLIETLRSIVPDTKFVEITATPQANILQKPDDERYPSFIIQIPPGIGYVGGNRLYDLENELISREHHRLVPDLDIDAIIKRSEEPEDAPESIYRALCVFLIGGAMKNLSSPDQSNFSMLIHISASMKVNNRLYNLTIKAKDYISRVLHGDLQNEKINKILEEAFEDIRSTISGGNNVSFNEAIDTVRVYIDQSRPQRITSQRGKDDPSYDAFYNILIGGNRISRGLTVKNLTVFYYARVSGAPKVDTILQHSRVYGYREQILDIIRIFSTGKVFDSLYDVYNSDEEQWEYLNSGDYKTNPPVLLPHPKTRGLQPTRTQVIPRESIVKYFPGKTYFLYHAKSSNVEKIDDLLKNTESKEEPEEITLELALKLIELTDTDRPEQRWKKDAVKQVLEYMRGKGNRIYIIVRRDRELKRNYRAVLSGQKENMIWKDDGPIIFMYRTSGGKEWNGEIAWIPVLRLPKGSNAYYFADTEPISDVGEE